MRLNRRTIQVEHAQALARMVQPHRLAFAHNLVRLRVARFMSQQEVADCIGKPQPTYAKWETGYGAPKLQDIVPLCKALSCTPNALFGWGRT